MTVAPQRTRHGTPSRLKYCRLREPIALQGVQAANEHNLNLMITEHAAFSTANRNDYCIVSGLKDMELYGILAALPC